MSKGSRRVTIRIGDELLDLVQEAITRHNESTNSAEPWTLSDLIVKAIGDKLNHGHRSARRERIVDVIKVADNEPRVVEER